MTHWLRAALLAALLGGCATTDDYVACASVCDPYVKAAAGLPVSRVVSVFASRADYDAEVDGYQGIFDVDVFEEHVKARHDCPGSMEVWCADTPSSKRAAWEAARKVVAEPWFSMIDGRELDAKLETTVCRHDGRHFDAAAERARSAAQR